MQALMFMFNGAMEQDKTKIITGLIVASLREGLGTSRYALAKEAGVDYLSRPDEYRTHDILRVCEIIQREGIF